MTYANEIHKLDSPARAELCYSTSGARVIVHRRVFFSLPHDKFWSFS